MIDSRCLERVSFRPRFHCKVGWVSNLRHDDQLDKVKHAPIEWWRKNWMSSLVLGKDGWGAAAKLKLKAELESKDTRASGTGSTGCDFTD